MNRGITYIFTVEDYAESTGLWWLINVQMLHFWISKYAETSIDQYKE